MTPLFTSGEISITIKGETHILRLTPRACALIEQKTGEKSYMDALLSIAVPFESTVMDEDGNPVTMVSNKPNASRCLAVFEALLEAAKIDPAIAEDVMTPDQFIMIGALLDLHMRPTPAGGENPPMAAGSSTPVA